jgi:hypothetical protein
MTLGEFFEREYAFWFKHDMDLAVARQTMIIHTDKGTKVTDIFRLPYYDNYFESKATPQEPAPPIHERMTAEEAVSQFNY